MSKRFDELKESIAAVIKNNGRNEIDGQILQDRLLAMVDSMELSDFEGFATPETDPVTDATIAHYYVAVEAGVYENFDSFVVTSGDIVVFSKAVGESDWSKIVLTEGIKGMLSDMDNRKQDKIEAGDGISVEDNTISIHAGDGLTIGREGDVKLEDAYVKNIAEQSIEEQKQSGEIVTTEEGGKIGMELLPDNIVMSEDVVESIDQLVDEYERVLAAAYQGIADLKVARTLAEKATSQLGVALDNSRSATQRANDAARAANEGADAVNGAIGDLNDALQEAHRIVLDAESRIIHINATIRECQEITAQCSLNSEAARINAIFAREQGEYAQGRGSYANVQGNFANEQGQYANEQGDYAKDRGDYAQAIMDSAKGDHENLAERLVAIESAEIVPLEDDDPTHLLQ